MLIEGVSLVSSTVKDVVLFRNCMTDWKFPSATLKNYKIQLLPPLPVELVEMFCR